MATAQLNVRIDADLKAAGDAVLDRFGVSSVQIVRSTWQYMVDHQRLPDFIQTRHVRKALGNLDNKRGAFAPDSRFAAELRSYFAGDVTFVDLSVEIGEFLAPRSGVFLPPIGADAGWRTRSRCHEDGRCFRFLRKLPSTPTVPQQMPPTGHGIQKNT